MKDSPNAKTVVLGSHFLRGGGVCVLAKRDIAFICVPFFPLLTKVMMTVQVSSFVV